jgi:chromosome segregation ATPase
VIADETRQTRGGCTPDNCALVTVINTHGTQIKSLVERVEGIQARKIDHETRLASLEMTQDHVVARVDRAESSLAQTTQALQELKGEMHGLKVITTNVSVTANSTYEMLREHIAHYSGELESTTARIERHSQKLTKAVAWIGAIAVLLAMIHSALSGQSLPAMITNLFTGIGL